MLCSLHVLRDYKVLAQFYNLETNFIKQELSQGLS